MIIQLGITAPEPIVLGVSALPYFSPGDDAFALNMVIEAILLSKYEIFQNGGLTTDTTESSPLSGMICIWYSG